MRIFGWVLLLGGFLLCASVAWAAIGFLFMGLGLICLRIAERRSERSARSVALLAEMPEDLRGQPSIVQGSPTVARKEANEREPREAEPDNIIGRRAYDEQRWRLLLSTDEDIRRLATILAHYGQSYIDEFAAAYLVLNDKEHLPMILEQLMASATRNRHRGTDNSADKSYDESVVVEGDGRKARSIHETTGKTDGHPETFVGHDALNTAAHYAPNGAGSERGVVRVRPIATGPLSPAEPPATGPDTKRRTLGEDPMDDDNLTNILG